MLSVRGVKLIGDGKGGLDEAGVERGLRIAVGMGVLGGLSGALGRMAGGLGTNAFGAFGEFGLATATVWNGRSLASSSWLHAAITAPNSRTAPWALKKHESSGNAMTR
jgi:hypothetical protein